MILPTEYEKILCLVRGLILLLCMVIQSLVFMGRSFVNIIDYVYTKRGIHCEA